jgi:hypothetical protein
LRQVQGFVQMANANLTSGQQAKQPQAHWIGERLEEFGANIQHIGSLVVHPHGQI